SSPSLNLARRQRPHLFAPKSQVSSARVARRPDRLHGGLALLEKTGNSVSCPEKRSGAVWGRVVSDEKSDERARFVVGASIIHLDRHDYACSCKRAIMSAARLPTPRSEAKSSSISSARFANVQSGTRISSASSSSPSNSYSSRITFCSSSHA